MKQRGGLANPVFRIENPVFRIENPVFRIENPFIRISTRELQNEKQLSGWLEMIYRLSFEKKKNLKFWKLLDLYYKHKFIFGLEIDQC